MREAYTQASSEDDILKDIKLRQAAGALTGEGKTAGGSLVAIVRQRSYGVSAQLLQQAQLLCANEIALGKLLNELPPPEGSTMS